MAAIFISEHVTEPERRFCSFEEDETYLRTLSSEGQLLCPDCREKVRFRAGTKRPHFYHHRKCEHPNPFHEPETEIHRMGKFVLYKWLSQLYPESRVELEYYLPETKQRSDVIVLHPNGERWAFEFQCSKISGITWIERHQLYQRAGIIDFWILSQEIARYAEGKASMIGLESVIHKNTLRLNYLDPKTKEVFFLLDGSLYGGGLEKSAAFTSLLEEVQVKNLVLWIKGFQEYELQKSMIELNLKKERDRIRQEEEQLRLEDEKLEEAFKRRTQETEEKKKKSLNENFVRILQERTDFQRHFTKFEKKLYISLCLKHKFDIVNFPGILHLNLKHSDLIITPPQLWQLWVFDEIVEQYDYCLKNNKPPRIWLDRTKERFKNLRKMGVLRIKVIPDDGVNYIFTLYDYISKLNDCGVLQQIGFSTRKYHDIRVNQLPLFTTHKENVLINMRFSGFVHENLQDIYNSYSTKLHDIFRDCLVKQPIYTPIYRSVQNTELLEQNSETSNAQQEVVVYSEQPEFQDMALIEREIPLNRLEYFREILARCKESEQLKIYPVFCSHIKRVEAIYLSFDQSQKINWSEWSLIYTIIENMKRPLLGE